MNIAADLTKEGKCNTTNNNNYYYFQTANLAESKKTW